MPKLKFVSKLYLIVILFFAVMFQIADVVYAVQGETTRVSVDSTGVQSNSNSLSTFISADGKFVVFESDATNLVAGDTNGNSDIFVYDITTGQTTRVSIDSSGVQGNNGSFWAFISADGRYVSFSSSASNLVAGDTNGFADVFVHDRTTSQTTRISIDSSGAQSNSDSFNSSISADGRYVTFESYATNLVAGDTNLATDIFVHDRTTGQTTRVSIDSSGAQGNNGSFWASISSDGRYVTFSSNSSNLVAGDTNLATDIFVHDRTTGQTTRISVDSAGTQGNDHSIGTSISADGRYVAFTSDATNLVASDTNGFSDIFVHDRTTDQTTRVSVNSSGAQGNNGGWFAFISADGRYVAFNSESTNLVDGDTNDFWDIFVHDFLGETPAVINGQSSSGGGGGCFIATAAYGSYFEPHVKVLRNFRDKVLLKNSIGSAFVKFYYTTSPPIADFISRYDSLRLVTRLALTPLVYAVKYPGVAVLTLLGLAITPFIRKRKHTGKIL